jgi:uncharacterized integral membrane protein (TIGR00697 family)
MDCFIALPLMTFLQSLTSELMSFVNLALCIVFILFLLRFFGSQGLILYNIVVIIAANIQVLKLAPFEWFSEPIALGTVTFSTAYLVSDMLTEHYGKEVAKKALWLSFAAQILMTVLMVTALGYKNYPEDPVHQSMVTLFLPCIRLLVASLIAYVSSQYVDIVLFRYVYDLSKGHLLWLRTSISLLVSALVDNTIFSVLAWVVLSQDPVSFKTLLYTYILGTYFARVAIGVITTPVMYLSYWFIPKEKHV